ncbi:MAG: DUF4405 domain-containing protein [Candidatus Diapherotrites archaeon]
MKKENLKYPVNLILGILFLSILITGIIKFLFLQPWLGLTDIVLPFAQISFIHDWTGILLIIFIPIHLSFNWGWIASAIKKFLGKG